MKYLENKIPPPLFAVLIALLMWASSFYGAFLDISGTVSIVLMVIFAATGLFVSMMAVAKFNEVNTTPNPLKPEKASSLVSNGIFRFTRNPMYVGVSFWLVAWAVYLSSLWAFIGVPVFILYITRFQIMPEERALIALFGSEYEAYKMKVRRWL